MMHVLCQRVRLLSLRMYAQAGVESGDRVTFIVDGNNVRVLNSAVYALMRFQEQMGGEAEKAGFLTEEAVAEWITRSRREENAE